MKTFSIDLPTLYGDHHVTEVRRLMFAMEGVEEVYASSGFRILEVTFDENKISVDQIKSELEQAGYLGELPIPTEVGTSEPQENGRKPFFRHTAAYEATQDVVGFTQKVPYSGRPLWPCPGMGPVKTNAEKETG